MNRIVIIGAGHVGSHCAYALAIRAVADEIVLIDLDVNKAEQQAQDIADAGCFFQRDIIVRGGDYEDCRTADIVVIAAGAPRKPVQLPDGSFVPAPRLTLMGESIRTSQDIIPKLKSSGFDGVIIGITNPADVVINYLYKKMGLPAERVFGTGTGLDTARLRRYLAEAAGCGISRVSAVALGEHGDSQIAPVSQMAIDGQKLDPAGKHAALNLTEVARLARTTGGRIIGGKGSTEFGIGTVLSDIAQAVLRDQKRIIPVSALLSGQYGVDGIHAGVPAVIGRGGIEQIIELDLSPDELAGFQASCAVISSYVEKADQL